MLIDPQNKERSPIASPVRSPTLSEVRSPTFSEVRSRSVPVGRIAYRLGSAFP
ncbi:hypothetical protein ACN4EW_29780 [Arthrospira platensis CENA650]